MGYSTDFVGRVRLDRKLAPEHAAYIRKFQRTRRMCRDRSVTARRPDPIREAVGLPVGAEGEFFVGGGDHSGQENHNIQEIQDRLSKQGVAPGDQYKMAHAELGIINFNIPPIRQHSLWCDWTVSDDDQGIEWSGAEKFGNYVEWLEYYIANFLKPWGYTANGEIHWQGESKRDKGTIIVIDNKVTKHEGDNALTALATAALGASPEWESYDRSELYEPEDEYY